MKRIVIITIVCFLIICLGYVYLCIKPIVLLGKLHAEYEFASDSIYNPIANYDFTKGHNLIILYTNYEEIPFLSNNVKKWTLLKCNDNKTIECIKNHFDFKKISEDYVGTTESGSKIYFIKNDAIIFESDIIIDDNSIALYFENTGWTFSMNASELLNDFSSFSPVYFPVIVAHYFETLLCISTRGQMGNGNFCELTDGIARIKGYDTPKKSDSLLKEKKQ